MGAAVEEYLSGVSRSERNVIDRTIEFLSLAAMGKDIQQMDKQIEEDIKEELSKLSEADLDTVLGSNSDSSSLLELEMVPGFIIMIILFAILAGVLLFVPPPQQE